MDPDLGLDGAPQGVDEIVDLHVASEDQRSDHSVTAASETESGKLDSVNKHLKLASLCLAHKPPGFPSFSTLD